MHCNPQVHVTHGSVKLNLTSSNVRPCYCEPCLSTMQMRINLKVQVVRCQAHTTWPRLCPANYVLCQVIMFMQWRIQVCSEGGGCPSNIYIYSCAKNIIIQSLDCVQDKFTTFSFTKLTGTTKLLINSFWI